MSTPTQTWNVEAYGMVPVSKDVFYAAIGKINVHPRLPRGPGYDPVYGYLSRWETPDGTLLGVSFGINGFQYGLVPSMAPGGGRA